MVTITFIVQDHLECSFIKFTLEPESFIHVHLVHNPIVGEKKKINVSMSSSEFGNRRTEYLKNGCRECKRRKIKCDEFIDPPPEAYLKINHQGRELCWQCTRLNKTCEYPLKGERVARVSRKILLEKNKKVKTENSPKGISSTSISPEERKGSISFQLEPPIPKLSPVSVPTPAPVPFQRPQIPSGIPPVNPFNPRFHPSPFTVPEIGPGISNGKTVFNPIYNEIPAMPEPAFPRFMQSNHIPVQDPISMLPNSPSTNTPGLALNRSGSYDSADLTLIATDLNNLVSDMIFEVNNDLKADNSIPPMGPEGLNADMGPPGSNKKRSKSYSHIPRNVGIGIFNVTQKERVYLQEFYLGFASVILPFNAYDTEQQSYYNPMRDILFYCAYNESFMLAAILAQGARSVFLQSNSPDDEFAYYKYLLRCLELLGPALRDHMLKRDLGLLPNIEAVLLTVLLLTSSNAANSKQNWRPHLRGAKDILLKHTTSRKDLSKSKLLLLCKYWFICFEILAGLGLKLGGTIEADDELDLLLSSLDRNEIQVLNNLGLVSLNGWYLIGGYHVDLIPVWKDLIKLLNKKRKDPAYKKDDTHEYLRLLAIFERQSSCEFVNKKGVLKNSDFQGGYIPAGLLLDLISVKQEHLIISWLDTSQQLYCLAGSITILTEFFEISYDSPQIQSLVQRLTSYLDFLLEFTDAPPLIKCAVMMIQWPMLVAGINLVREKDQLLALKFFDLAMKAGAGSAGYTISRMKRIWKARETGITEPIDDDVDVVNY